METYQLPLTHATRDELWLQRAEVIKDGVVRRVDVHQLHAAPYEVGNAVELGLSDWDQIGNGPACGILLLQLRRMLRGHLREMQSDRPILQRLRRITLYRRADVTSNKVIVIKIHQRMQRWCVAGQRQTICDGMLAAESLEIVQGAGRLWLC